MSTRSPNGKPPAFLLAYFICHARPRRKWHASTVDSMVSPCQHTVIRSPSIAMSGSLDCDQVLNVKRPSQRISRHHSSSKTMAIEQIAVNCTDAEPSRKGNHAITMPIGIQNKVTPPIIRRIQKTEVSRHRCTRCSGMRSVRLCGTVPNHLSRVDIPALRRRTSRVTGYARKIFNFKTAQFAYSGARDGYPICERHPVVYTRQLQYSCMAR